jgi:uncharacterized protein YwgA
MTEKERNLVRTADVMLSLAAASQYGQRLNKIRLQKFIYLADAVSSLFALLPPEESHTTYMHGPYDAAIQRAVDTLAFRGFVTIHGIRPHAGGVSADYGLSDAGSQLANRLSTDLVGQAEIYMEVAARISRIGWPRLKALAYAEPTFVDARARGYGRQLEVTDGLANSSALILSVIDRVLDRESLNYRPSRAIILDLFFGYLSEYASLTAGEPDNDAEEGGVE